MKSITRYLQNLKETLLLVSVAYFYVLAFALHSGRETYGMDSAAVFIGMSTAFLIAICLEVLLAWWNKRLTLLWVSLAVVSYGIIGLYLAPAIYGAWILPFVLLEPLIVVFVGGFAFSSGHLIARSMFETVRLSPSQVESVLRDLPGWSYQKQTITKSFEFVDFAEALNFMNRAVSLGYRNHHHPKELHLEGNRLTISLSTFSEHDVTVTDVNMARNIEAL